MSKKSNTIESTPRINEETPVVETPKTYTVAELYAQHKTTSGVIRALYAGGMAKADIAKLIGKRYQHVRNVLLQPLKSTPVEATETPAETDEPQGDE